MTAPAIAPAMPPIAAPFFAFAWSSTCANALPATSNTVKSDAICFFIFSLLVSASMSQQPCHTTNKDGSAAAGRLGPAVAVYASQAMPAERPMREVLRNMLQSGDLPFRDFVELVLY